MKTFDFFKKIIYIFNSMITSKSLAQKIDHTVLSPQTTASEVYKLCQEAKELQFYCVCVNPYYLSLAKSLLTHSKIKTCTVIGFPLGIHTTKVKVYEASQALRQDVDELDMPMNLGEFKQKNYKKVKEDIEAVVRVAEDKVLKVIVGTSFLNREELKTACLICQEAGAQFVKTSTGFFKPGACVEDIKTMKEAIGNDIKIKASGGIRSWKQTQQLLEAGACRIGSSSSVQIIEELRHEAP